MNKKGGLGDILLDNIMFLIILVLFFSVIFIFVTGQQEGRAVWEQFYATEISRVINLAQPGDEITLDVHRATVIAKKNGIQFSSIFNFDNVGNEVQVKLGQRGGTTYRFYNEVDVVEWEIEPGLADGVNKLKFKVIKSEVS